jgi:transposase-like protein
VTEISMSVLNKIRKLLEDAEGDGLREMVRVLAEALMNAEVDGLCGAGHGERSPERVNHRNGYRSRRWDTRVGTIDLQIPRTRKGSYFPEGLLEPRRRSEKALLNVVAESYVLGVSTRKVERLVEQLGLEGISKSQVSVIAKQLDETVEDFRNRPLSGRIFSFVWLDALKIKIRRGGRVVNAVVVVATGTSSEGFREILGLDVFASETEAAWLDFLRSLVNRGLSGVELVTSDAHPGLVSAVNATLPGTSWQRCRTHFMTNLLAKVDKSARAFVATLVRTIFLQPDAKAVWNRLWVVVEQLEQRFPEAAELLEISAPDLLAFAAFPTDLWTKIWSNNPQERLNKEIRRRTDVVGIFPNRAAVIRLVGALLCEQTDEWAIGRRYMSLTSLHLARDRSRSFQPPTRREALPESLPLSA